MLEDFLTFGEVHTDQGQNQEVGLQWLCETHWVHILLKKLIDIFPSIVYVLEYFACECPNYLDRHISEI